MKLTGGCYCGAIRYRAEAEGPAIGLCHCTDCQRLSGSPYRASVRVAAQDFAIERGEPTIYIKTAHSGNRRAQAFCGGCGSPIYAADAAGPTSYTLRLGSIDQRAELIPRGQIWCRSRLAWSADLRPIPGAERDG